MYKLNSHDIFVVEDYVYCISQIMKMEQKRIGGCKNMKVTPSLANFLGNLRLPDYWTGRNIQDFRGIILCNHWKYRADGL